MMPARSVYIGVLWLTLAVFLPAFSAATQSAELRAVEVSGTSVVITAADVIPRVAHFELDKPKRLVIDLYGVSGGRVPPPTALSGGFRQLRAAGYADKSRVVLDVTGADMPEYRIAHDGRRVTVTWPGSTPPRAGAEPPARPGALRPRITAVDVDAPGDARSGEPAQAQVRISLEPFVDADQVRRFVLREPNRLVVDLSGVRVGRHARSFDLGHGFDRLRIGSTPERTRLVFDRRRGPLPAYEVVVDPESRQLVVSWGAAQIAAPPAAAGAVARTAPPSATSVTQPPDATPATPPRRETREYVGERRTFVYDNTDIRIVLQDISAAGNRQLVIADGISGQLTLRLVNVPWDQALDMVLEVARLRSLEQGDLLRIFPERPADTPNQATEDAVAEPDSDGPDTLFEQ